MSTAHINQTLSLTGGISLQLSLRTSLLGMTLKAERVIQDMVERRELREARKNHAKDLGLSWKTGIICALKNTNDGLLELRRT